MNEMIFLSMDESEILKMCKIIATIPVVEKKGREKFLKI